VWGLDRPTKYSTWLDVGLYYRRLFNSDNFETTALAEVYALLHVILVVKIFTVSKYSSATAASQYYVTKISTLVSQ